MNLLDMRTVLISYAISNFMCTIVLIMLWRQNRQRFAGIGFWLACYVFLFAALSLLALRGTIPNILSVGLGTPLVIASAVVMVIGLAHFTGRSPHRPYNYLILVAFIALQEYFAFVSPDMTMRNHIFSIAFLLLSAQCAYLLFRGGTGDMCCVSCGTALIFLAFCVVCIFRFVLDIRFASDPEFLRSNTFNTASVIALQMLHIILALFLFLMVNGRLFADLEGEIATRKQTEETLRKSEEKVFLAFNSSPDAVFLSRLEDGKFVEVNEGFCRLFGISREEALSSNAIDLELWENPEDRSEYVSLLLQHHRIRNHERNFRTKSGIILHCLVSSELIEISQEPHIVSVIRDISQRKQAERIVRIRLELWEYAAIHSIRELMQKALDEVERLTGSVVGFFYFIDDGKSLLHHQVWSTRTLSAGCNVEKSDHYTLKENGVWADCLQMGIPVVHNDYASFPGSKDLPQGHIPLLRELVVPVKRDGKVVALLGVGNKPDAYTERDSEHAQFIADIAWSIIEQKQSYERIVELNQKLENQAMTDELTGLDNRRAFFIHGEEEVLRANRYDVAFALLMLDLDKFKDINDTYGHDAGDKVLQCFAATLRQSLRATDIPGRLGGEEFGVLLPNTTGAAATALGERLRQAVEEAQCQYQDNILRITVSIGVSEFDSGASDFATVLHKADNAMYLAKTRGRNQVVNSAEPS